MNTFRPFHINATPEDLAGNNDLGRYIILCGSNDRADKIAQQFINCEVKMHPRQHNLFLGQLQDNEHTIDVASISTGMGCPSIDIIVSELALLGAKRFLRVGTAGSLQPSKIKVGSMINVTAAVRDESTSICYLPAEYPAIASMEMICAIASAAKELALDQTLYTGVVHTKSSFYAREMQHSDLKSNSEYMLTLKSAGVLASEMECSHLFILSSLLNYRAIKQTDLKRNAILAGAILAIIGDETPIQSASDHTSLIDQLILMGLTTIKQLAKQERDS